MIPQEIPPLVVLADRDMALASACGQLPDEHARILSPYFVSASGTKVIQGRRVEGGEGHGPRKEFFVIATSDALKKWSPVVLQPPGETQVLDLQVSFKGNRISIG